MKKIVLLSFALFSFIVTAQEKRVSIERFFVKELVKVLKKMNKERLFLSA